MNEIVFVGTSDAFGAGGRRQSAIFVRDAAGGVLLDCGATTGSGLDALSIPRDAIDTILVSHFHGDHFGGIPLLLLAALYEDERRHPLRVSVRRASSSACATWPRRWATRWRAAPSASASSSAS